jgi:hypothetical protein
MFGGRGKGNHSILFSNFSLYQEASPSVGLPEIKEAMLLSQTQIPFRMKTFLNGSEVLWMGREIFLYKPFKTVLN